MPWNLPLAPAGSPENELTAGQDGATIRRSVLPGGVRVLTEHMPGLRSATVGAWVGVGSRDETSGHYGSTHFLEHLLFKGTQRRTAMDIAEAFDAVGGEANAGTGKEHTVYYARVLDSDLPMAVDVITDMVTSARIDEAELETERGVILEELAMNDDDPSDVAHEEFAAAVLAGHALGRPIGGTPEAINAVPRSAVWEHYKWHYRPETLVISAAGGVDHDALCTQVAAALSDGGWDLADGASPRARRDSSDITGVGEIGTFGLYAGCTPAKVDEVSALLVSELERLADSGITPAELERSIGQLSGGLVLGLEDSGSRMSRLGKADLVTGELLSVAESLERIRSVTSDEVQALAKDLASRPRSTVRVGPFGD